MHRKDCSVAVFNTPRKPTVRRGPGGGGGGGCGEEEEEEEE